MGKPGEGLKPSSSLRVALEKGTGGTETSKYPEEEEATAMP
tara:strand:- start:47371 stop:47493 length:123 start_codon:yes stop_codon:yes gene_type:complete